MPDQRSAVVIGAGTAGTSAARALASAGWRVTTIERDRVGGNCLWHGCIPKKALYTSARINDAIRNADRFGIDTVRSETDWQTVLAWKWHAQETYAGDQEASLGDHGIELAKGEARFTSPDSVEVNGRTLRADAFVVATGSRPKMPNLPGIDLADTSEDALGYLTVPKSLVIVGAGFVGLEFAGIYSSFGTHVIVIDSNDRPMPMIDAEAAAVAVRALRGRGVEFIDSTRVIRLSGQRGNLSVDAVVGDSKSPLTIPTDRVLMATGRRPAVASLDLDLGGIETADDGAIVVDAFLRTTNPRVWLAGDVAGGRMQTPVAAYEGRTVAQSIISDTPVQPDCSAVPTTLFTVPEIAQVGLTAERAASAGISTRVAVQSLENIGAAVIDDSRDGIIKLLFAERDDRLVGAQIAAPHASDLIYSLAVGIQLGATSRDLRAVLGVHPAYSEAVNWAAWS